MEENKKSFGYIFTNVIWYHYRWLILVLVFAVAVVVFTVMELRGRVDYDYNLAVVVGSEIPLENPEFERKVCDAVGDINGDGEVNVNFQYLLMADEQWGSGNQERVMLYLASDDFFLFLADDDYSRAYSAAEYFDPVEPYGLDADESLPTRVKLADTADIEVQLYANIIDWTTVGKGEKAELEATLRVINALS